MYSQPTSSPNRKGVLPRLIAARLVSGVIAAHDYTTSNPSDHPGWDEGQRRRACPPSAGPAALHQARGTVSVFEILIWSDGTAHYIVGSVPSETSVLERLRDDQSILRAYLAQVRSDFKEEKDLLESKVSRHDGESPLRPLGIWYRQRWQDTGVGFYGMGSSSSLSEAIRVERSA